MTFPQPVDLETRPRFGAWTSLAHPSITELFTRAGVDFVGIDLEHSTISQEQAQRIIAAAHAGGAACLPRVSSHNSEQIARLLDSGADGVIVPNVSTPAQVGQIVSWCLYPPAGKRSYGVARAQGYGFDFHPYTAEWNQRCRIVIQVESMVAVEAIETLLTHEAVHGVMIGPYDISGTMGIPGQLTHPRVTAACEKVVAACRRHRKACGTQVVEPNLQRITEAFAAGYTFVVLASDVFVLWHWSERMRAMTDALRQSWLQASMRKRPTSQGRPVSRVSVARRR